jgi:hypothetical protein
MYSFDTELRNRVYEYAATTQPPSIVRSQGGAYAALTRVCRRIRHEYLPLLAITIPPRLFRSQDGTYAALTRVCRQIRHEYLPIQRRAATVVVDWNDVNSYMGTFYKHNMDSTALPGAIKVRLDSARSWPAVCNSGVDLLPFLFLQRTSSVFVCFDVREGSSEAVYIERECKQLNKFLEFKHVSWEDTVRSGKLDSVKVHREHRHTVKICLAFKQDQRA